jgi:hypothetical protein
MRRAFNQELNLFECIVEEMASDQPSNVMVDIITPLEYPWTSMPDLRDSLAEGPHSKAKAKYAATVDMLASHEVFAQFNSLQEVIQALFVRVRQMASLVPDVVTPSEVKSSSKRRRVVECSIPSHDPCFAPVKADTLIYSSSASHVETVTCGHVVVDNTLSFLGSDHSLDNFMFDEHIFGDAFIKHFVAPTCIVSLNDTTTTSICASIDCESSDGVTSCESDNDNDTDTVSVSGGDDSVLLLLEDGLDFDSFFDDELLLF